MHLLLEFQYLKILRLITGVVAEHGNNHISGSIMGTWFRLILQLYKFKSCCCQKKLYQLYQGFVYSKLHKL